MPNSSQPPELPASNAEQPANWNRNPATSPNECHQGKTTEYAARCPREVNPALILPGHPQAKMRTRTPAAGHPMGPQMKERAVGIEDAADPSTKISARRARVAGILQSRLICPWRNAPRAAREGAWSASVLEQN